MEKIINIEPPDYIIFCVFASKAKELLALIIKETERIKEELNNQSIFDRFFFKKIHIETPMFSSPIWFFLSSEISRVVFMERNGFGPFNPTAVSEIAYFRVPFESLSWKVDYLKREFKRLSKNKKIAALADLESQARYSINYINDLKKTAKNYSGIENGAK